MSSVCQRFPTIPYEIPSRKTSWGGSKMGRLGGLGWKNDPDIACIEESYTGVDAKWGRFPICPEMSSFVLFCPDLSPFWAPRRTKEDKRGQNGTFRDKLGNAPI